MPLPLSVFQRRPSRGLGSDSRLSLDDRGTQTNVIDDNNSEQRQLFPSISDVTRIYRQLVNGTNTYTSLPSLAWAMTEGTNANEESMDSSFGSRSDDTYPTADTPSVFRIPRPRFQSSNNNNIYRRRLLELFRISEGAQPHNTEDRINRILFENNLSSTSSDHGNVVHRRSNSSSTPVSELSRITQDGIPGQGYHSNNSSAGYHGIPLTNFFPTVRTYIPANMAMDHSANDLEHWSSAIRSTTSFGTSPPLPPNILRRQYSSNTNIQRGQHYHDIQSPKKSVYLLHCSYCSKFVCHRGMKATLLANTNIHLYSTDAPPPNSVHLMEEDYCTSSCQCQLRDVGCLGCGNVIGYHVTQPCSSCMSSSNNGHFWMFHSQGVYAQMRLDGLKRPITWSQLYNHAFIRRNNTMDHRGSEYCYVDLHDTLDSNISDKQKTRIDTRPYMYDDGYHLYDGNNISDKHSKWIPPYEDFCR